MENIILLPGYKKLEKLAMKRSIFLTGGTEKSWWKSLGPNVLLEMAHMLSESSLPVWKNAEIYKEIKDELKYLPENALKEIEIFIKGGMACKLKLNEYFTSFITPVIQIQDGHLKFPFDVKQSFLAVFHILKGIVNPANDLDAIESFSAAIKKSIDAIKISKILSADEVLALTNKYYKLSQQK